MKNIDSASSPASTTDTSDLKSVSYQTLATVVRGLTSGYPRHDAHHAPGRLDSHVRRALTLTFPSWGTEIALLRFFAERHPEIWEVIGGGPLARGGLNPQPLPPRLAFVAALAQDVVEHIALAQETIELLDAAGTVPAKGVVGRRLTALVDELCGNTLRIWWPFPGPRPNWLGETLNAIDLIVMGLRFQDAATETPNRDFGRTLTDAGARLLSAGAERGL
jgi:hypothetical protein